MRMIILPAFVFVLLFASFSRGVFAQTTEFTFQGSLKDGPNSANGNYDFVFRLYDALNSGTQVGPTLSPAGVSVVNGAFSVRLDFGAQFLGANRFLDILVRPASVGPYTPLTPRQQILSVPYSIQSLNAASASNAAQLNGVPAAGYVLTNDPRMSDARSPSAGSANYVQNTGVQQAASQFNISGNGTAGGTLSANIVNATTQFNINGNRAFSVAGTENTFAGGNAGISNTTGTDNSFFGFQSGAANVTSHFNSFFGHFAGASNTASFNTFVGESAGRTNVSGTENSFVGFSAGFASLTGFGNSFFGAHAGQSNTGGDTNSFFGSSAGLSNTVGAQNSFFGLFAGQSNVSGGNNTILGHNANVGSGALNFATALGAGATVNTSNTVVLGRAADSVQVPGDLSVTGTLTGSGSSITNLNASNIASGTLNNARLGIVPISNGGTGSATQNFVDLTTPQTISGDKTFSGTVTATFAGSGANLGNLNASNISSGTLTLARLPNPLTLTGAQAGSSIMSGTNSATMDFSTGLRGESTAVTSGTTYGVYGQSASNFGSGVYGLNSNSNGRAVGGLASSASGINYGGYFQSASTSGTGAFGYATAASGTTNGVYGLNDSPSGRGVFGSATAFTGANAGGYFQSASTDGRGVFGIAGASTGPNYGGYFQSASTGGYGVFGFATATTGTTYGVYGASASTSGQGVYGVASATSGTNYGGFFSTMSAAGYGVYSIGRGYFSGNVGIGNLAPSAALDVVGNGHFTGPMAIDGNLTINSLGAVTATNLCFNLATNVVSFCSSSLRYKNNISSFKSGFNIVDRLRPVTFEWKGTNQKDLGLIAEEVEAVDPLLVTYNKEGLIQGVKYDQLSVVMVNAIKEQQAEIEMLQKQVASLAAENRSFKTRLSGLLAKRRGEQRNHFSRHY